MAVVPCFASTGRKFDPLIAARRHEMTVVNLWRELSGLAAEDLRVYLVCTRIEQVDGPILQCPEVAIQRQVIVGSANPFTRHHLGRFNSYRRCLYRYRLRASRAGRQAEADQPTCEQPGSYA